MKNKPSFNLQFWQFSSISQLKVLFLALTMLAILLFGFWRFANDEQQNQQLSSKQLLSLPDHTLIVSPASRGQQSYLKFELVNSPLSISKGLSGRKSLGSDGMLFVFAKVQIPQFWMKEMLFDLDFVWLLDGVVVDLTANVKTPDHNLSLDSLPTYSPRRPVNMVLELPAGLIDSWHLRVGDRFELFASSF